MDLSYEKKYHLLEETNWWFVARRKVIGNIIKKLNINSDDKILEVGCSGGQLIKYLNTKKILNITGIDISEKAIFLCKEKNLDNCFVMDGSNITLNNDEYNLIIASDILEHIKDDEKALEQWYSKLKAGGKIIIFVPAFKFLWSNHDEVNHHYRRYSRKELIKKCQNAGFNVKRSSFWNHFLFFPVSIIRLLNQLLVSKTSKQDEGQLYELNKVINYLLITLLNFENFLLKYINFHVGVSVFIVAEK